MTDILPLSSLPLGKIKIGKRHRQDYGDIQGLARSIDEQGLLQPVVITPTGDLIAGERRIRAWPRTKFRDDEIPVHVVDLEQIVRGELAENTDRKDFSLSEAVAMEAAIAALVATPVGRPNKEISENGANLPKGKTTDKVAAFTRKSGRTLEKAKAVVSAAKADPEKFGKLAEDMDRTGRVDGPYKRLRVIEQAAELRKEPPPLPNRGPYRVIVVDPPWPYELRKEDPSHRATHPYPQMSLADIRAMLINSVAHPDCVLWLWTTNHHLREAFTVLDSWGFVYKTMLTWVKDRFGTGDWLRGQTEHCLMAVRGKPIVHLTNQSTVLNGPMRANSQKPDEFYAFVESLCPAPRYAEFFSRTSRKNWDGHGDQLGKFVAVAPAAGGGA